MQFKKLTLAFVFILSGTASIKAQQLAPLPIDPNVRYGQLENGLTYYVRHNEYPPNRAEFYIAQKVGSILEEENQRGLAHFLEHMAFNGTVNFPGKSMLNYLESIGVKFGANVNAYTSFDETVYNLSNVPVVRESIVDSCLLILHDWSCAIALEEKEIDEERGVIREEWRTRTDANMRMWDILIPTMFAGSQYANRMPIGTMEVVMNFPYQTLRDYYHKWYRPDQQGIIVVGDIDAEKTEEKIKELFGKIKMPENVAERIYYTVPDNKESIVTIGKDKEATSTSVMVFYKHDPMPKTLKATVAGIIDEYLKSVTSLMLNARLEEIAEMPDAPFLSASTYDDDFFVSKTKNAFTGQARSKEGGSAEALEALLKEIERVNQHGFTATEYDRAKANLLSYLEQIYNEKDKAKNSSYVQEYVSHFTEGGAIPGIENEYLLYRQFAEGITLEQVNDYIQNLIGEENIVIAITGPEKDGVAYPTAEEIIAIQQKVSGEELAAYEDNTSDEPLLPALPVPGKIEAESFDKTFGTTVWTLSNGAKVVLKPTDFKNDQILLSAVSHGGKSLYGNNDLIDLAAFNPVIGLSKTGAFSNIELQKMLAGKQVASSIGLGEYTESIGGSSTPKDMETMLQLVYLNFTDINKDDDAFLSWKQRSQAAMKNKEANPASAFSDSLNVAIWNNDPRMRSLKAEDVDKIDYDRILSIWKERFGDASDFTFIFVGNINPDTIRPLIEQYIASLPSTYSKEKSGKAKIQIRKGKYVNDFERKMETPKSTVFCLYSGKHKYNYEDVIKLSMFDQIMDIVYTSTIREEEGGTYGVSTQSSLSKERGEWMFLFGFDTNPEMQDKLRKRAVDELMKVVTEGPSAENVNKVKEYMLKKQTEDIRENKYWMSKLNTYVLYGTDEMHPTAELIRKQTPESIKKLTKKIFNPKNYIQVSMKGITE
ncbi:MAG: insulinase family protein [Coprobacter sp.]|nr:insulinase family protein [Coprobacter sp.]